MPWIPVLPFVKYHRFKWFDWAEALDVKLTDHKLMPSSTQEAWAALSDKEGSRIARRSGAPKRVVQSLDWGVVRVAAMVLGKAVRSEPTLSSDAALSRATGRLQDSAHAIQRDFAA